MLNGAPAPYAFDGVTKYADKRILEAICAFQAIVPKTTDWKSFESTYVWDAGPALKPSYNA